MPIGREQILDAALAVAEERGIEAVTMRAVAARVGVTPMALYPHVGSKAAILDGMVGRLLGRLPVPPAEATWQERLRAVARGARELARAYPAAFPLLFARPSVTPDAVGAVDEIYRALLDAGVPPEQVPRLERMVSTFVLGYAVSEVNGRFAPDDRPGDGPAARGRRAEGLVTGSGRRPAHAVLAPWLSRPVDWDAEFEADLADLSHLIERAATGTD